MVRAYVMVVTASGTSPGLIPQIEAIEGVREAHVVAGDFDIVVELEAEEPSDLLPIVTRGLQGLDGVGHTRTYVALDEP